MAAVVALDLPGGPGFVDALRRVWDRGDTAFPLDQRLAGPAQATVLATVRPTSVIDDDGEHPLDGIPSEPGDALVMATSGTSGNPKGVVLTHDAVAASAAATTTRLRATSDAHWLACLPLSHVGGLAVVTRALLSGAQLTVHPGFDAARVEAAARAGATHVSLVATALARIDPTLFRVIVLGGSRPPADLPANTVTTYGLTETGSGVVYDGRPLDGVELRIHDGEILLRGPMLLRAYRDGSPACDRDGWFATGDLGRLLPDGRLHVDGRRDEVIISGGENVWPQTVEAILATHPGVADVAVIGRDDPEWGSRVVACVVPADRAAPPRLDALRELVAAHAAAYMAPKALELVDAIPRTSLGKVARAELARRG